MPNKDMNSPEIIERIYDVAVDPTRLEELIDVWEERIAPLRAEGNQFDEKTNTTLSHFSRMGLFLDRLQITDSQQLINEISAAGPLAAIACSANFKVQQLNNAATTLFNLHTGDDIASIAPEPNSKSALNQAITDVIKKPDAAPVFLRFRIESNKRIIVAQIRGIEKPATKNHDQQIIALIITTEMAWQPSFAHTIRNAFNLSNSEIDIVRALVEGHNIDSIATMRSRSKATIRTQIRSIFEKTETRSQAELVRISLSLMDMTSFTEEKSLLADEDIIATQKLKPNEFFSLTRPQNRRLDHVILGDPDGAPLLYLPSDYGLIRWPASAEAEAKARGYKIIVPVRAGYGYSDQIPAKSNYQDQVSDDFAALLDHHNVSSCPIMTQQGDIWLASIFATRHPKRVSAIIAMSPILPMWNRAQYDRMDKWYKFILANARYAPRLLPFMVKAGFYLALSIGRQGFMSAIFADSDADKDIITIPEVYEALITGSSVTLSKQHTAYETFAREAVLQAKQNWIEDFEALKGKIPVHTIQGQTSPAIPPPTLDEFIQRYDWIEFQIKPDAGELVFFKYWPEILDFMHPFIKKNHWITLIT